MSSVFPIKCINGLAVSKKPRRAAFSLGGEAIFSAPIYNDPEVGAMLKESSPIGGSVFFRETVKGYDEPVDLWRMKL
jgi:hypothetical protein